MSTPMSGPRAGVLLHTLRERTAPDHTALEQLTGLPERLAEPGRYAGFLQGLLVVIAPLERTLTGLPPALDPGRTRWSARSKAVRLRADLDELAAVGAAPAPVDPAPPGNPGLDDGLTALLARLQARPDPASAYGARYVLEGATLGGRQLAPQVPGALGLPPGRVTRYLDAYGEEAGAAWREFRRRAERVADGTQPAVTAATVVFRACRTAIDAAFGAHGVRSAA